MNHISESQDNKVKDKIKVGLKPIVQGINLPKVIKISKSPGEEHESLFVATQVGEILKIDKDDIEIILDICNDIIELGYNSNKYDERGLIGFELHPEFCDNGIFWIYYSHRECPGKPIHINPVNPSDPSSFNQCWDNKKQYDHINTLEEWKYCKEGKSNFRRTLLKIKQPFYNNNGFNNVTFSPESKTLIIATGDGGSDYDPFNLSQNDNSIYGKLISLDPSRVKKCNEEIYPITTISELYEQHGSCVYILAKGLRNP